MSCFPVGRRWRGLYRKLFQSHLFWLQPAQLVLTASALVANAEIFVWHWTPVQDSRLWGKPMNGEWKASSGLWSSSSKNSLHTFSHGLVSLLNRTTEWSFWISGIDFSLLLLGGRTENLPDNISPWRLSVPTEIFCEVHPLFIVFSFKWSLFSAS